MFKGNSNNSAHSAPCFWILGTRYNEHFKSDFISCLAGLAWLGLASFHISISISTSSTMFNINSFSILYSITNSASLLAQCISSELGLVYQRALLTCTGSALAWFGCPTCWHGFHLATWGLHLPFQADSFSRIVVASTSYIDSRTWQYLILHVITLHLLIQ